MKALKIVGAVFAVVVAGILVAAALKPAEYMVTRELEVLAPPPAIFAHINSTKLADAWMPWAEMDANVRSTYEGPEAGVGSISKWNSTGGMGTGSAQVIESIPNQKVRTRVLYEKPMKMDQISEITLTPTTAGTMVRWTVTGSNSFMGRLMCLFTNMDKMVGDMFLKGLGNLKSKVESNS